MGGGACGRWRWPRPRWPRGQGDDDVGHREPRCDRRTADDQREQAGDVGSGRQRRRGPPRRGQGDDGCSGHQQGSQRLRRLGHRDGHEHGGRSCRRHWPSRPAGQWPASRRTPSGSRPQPRRTTAGAAGSLSGAGTRGAGGGWRRRAVSVRPRRAGDRWMLASAAIAPAPMAPTRNQITVVTSEGCPLGAPELRCGTGHTPVNTSGAVTRAETPRRRARRRRSSPTRTAPKTRHP